MDLGKLTIRHPPARPQPTRMHRSTCSKLPRPRSAPRCDPAGLNELDSKFRALWLRGLTIMSPSHSRYDCSRAHAIVRRSKATAAVIRTASWRSTSTPIRRIRRIRAFDRHGISCSSCCRAQGPDADQEMFSTTFTGEDEPELKISTCYLQALKKLSLACGSAIIARRWGRSTSCATSRRRRRPEVARSPAPSLRQSGGGLSRSAVFR